MKDPSGTRTRPEKGREIDSPHPVEEVPPKVPSVPDGMRPVLIVEPGGEKGALGERTPLSARRRRDPLLGPEVLAARARTEAFKAMGGKIVTLAGVMGNYISELRSRLERPGPGKDTLRRALEVVGWMEEAHEDLRVLGEAASAGMAEIELSSLIRDAVKRAHPGNSRVRFRLPDLDRTCFVTAHPRHMLDALTLSVEILLDRIHGRGEIVVTLEQTLHYAEIRVTGIPAAEEPEGTLPSRENVARLRHLVVAVHGGFLSSETGPGGEPTIKLGIPLKRT